MTNRHNGHPFSTWDSDHDSWSKNCAQLYHGAWWYRACHLSNLNGLYNSTLNSKGVNWKSWKGYYISMSGVRMLLKIK